MPQTSTPEPLLAPQQPTLETNLVRLTVKIMDGNRLLGGACVLARGARSTYSRCDGDPEDLDVQTGRIAFAVPRATAYEVSEMSPPEGYALSADTVSIAVGTMDMVVAIRHDD